MKRVIIDTNALMAINDFKLDIFTAISEALDFKFELDILSGTIVELKQIKAEQRGKFSSAAKLALMLIKEKEVNVIDMKGKVDDVLVEYSKKGNLVLTQDIELKSRLKKPYLTIRQKKKIIVVR